MMEKPVFKYVEPKRKRGTFDFETGPFPIPIQSLIGTPNFYEQFKVFEGHLKGDAVHICSQSDIETVYRMGFFGKGNLSWSAPEYNFAGWKNQQLQNRAVKLKISRLLSRERYRKRLEWRNADAVTQEITGQLSGEESSEVKTGGDKRQVCEGTTESLTESGASVNCPNHSCTRSPIRSSAESEKQDLECLSGDVSHTSVTTDVGRSSDRDGHINLRTNHSSKYVDVDKSCVREDVDANTVVVMEDTEDEDDATSASVPLERQTDPFPLKENLQLRLEEAFFLSFALGCLVVTDPDMGAMNLTQMWQRFSQINDRFVSLYIAYHHFRSKGFVVKPGLKYGVDFVLYKKGPPFYHSSYSVNVVTADEGRRSSVENPRLNFTSLSCVNRITEQVSKQLMFCIVIKPSDLSAEEQRSPKCCRRFKVKEVIVQRWVSNKEREADECMEMP